MPIDRQQANRWLSVAGILYAAAMLVWIGPDPWMYVVWGVLGVVIAAVVGAVAWLGEDDATPATRIGRMTPGIVATVLFAVVAVLAATLETRDPSRIGFRFTMLGLGMSLSVVLYLASYDRSKRPGAEAD